MSPPLPTDETQVRLLNSDFESRPDAFIALHREATRKSAGHELGDFFFIPRGLGS